MIKHCAEILRKNDAGWNGSKFKYIVVAAPMKCVKSCDLANMTFLILWSSDNVISQQIALIL